MKNDEMNTCLALLFRNDSRAFSGVHLGRVREHDKPDPAGVAACQRRRRATLVLQYSKGRLRCVRKAAGNGEAEHNAEPRARNRLTSNNATGRHHVVSLYGLLVIFNIPSP